jgi:hypothetical protein
MHGACQYVYNASKVYIQKLNIADKKSIKCIR